MDDDLAVDDFFEDDLFDEEDDDPVATAVCKALYPVLSGVFARELVLALGK